MRLIKDSASSRGRLSSVSFFCPGIFLFTFLAVIAGLAAEGPPSQEITEGTAVEIRRIVVPEVEYPVSGMRPGELIETLHEIKALCDPDTSILQLRFLGPNRLEIKTGTMKGPLEGHGRILLFERKEGRWLKITQHRWVS